MIPNKKVNLIFERDLEPSLNNQKFFGMVISGVPAKSQF
jgi:hypothetical protein